MLDIHERIKKLMSNGCDRETAILIEWKLLDKESPSFFKEVQEFYDWSLVNSPILLKILEVAMKKAETFEEFKWIWDNLEMESEQRIEFFSLMKTKAETLEDLQFLWKQTVKESSEKCGLLGRMMDKAKELHK